MSTKVKTLYAYLFLTIVYAAGALLLPPPEQTLHRYHITSGHYKLIDGTAVVLFVCIWFCAVYAFYNFRQYYQLIKKTKEGVPLSHITTGLGFLAFWLPLTGVFDVYTNYLTQKHPSLTGTVTVLQNYLNLLLPLIGFIFLSVGARRLIDRVKQRPSLMGINSLVLILISVGVTYVYLLTSAHSHISVYHLPTFYLLTTVAIPYLYMWFMGLLSAYEIFLYRAKAPGIIYRQSWQLLAFGMSSLIALSITIEFLVTISEQLNKLSFNRALMVIYALLILMAITYVLIALGARNLRKIEEV